MQFDKYFKEVYEELRVSDTCKIHKDNEQAFLDRMEELWLVLTGKKSMNLKSTQGWVLKSKKANHSVVGGIIPPTTEWFALYYLRYDEAMKEFNKLPENGNCGTKEDYEVVEVLITPKKK